MKKILFALFFVFCMIVIPHSSRAQGWLQFEELLIEIWPEYDQPGVLVIYRGKLSSTEALPAEVTFQIPVEAGQPNAVAIRNEQGQLMSVQFERIVRGDLAEISFLSPAREIQFEYYDPGLERDGKSRSYRFVWLDGHLVQSAYVQVQQPQGAYEMSIIPELEDVFEGSDGFVYYFDNVQLLDPGVFTLQLNYQKENEALSVTNASEQSSTPPIEPESILSARGRDLAPWVLGGIGILMIGTGLFLYWRSEKGGSSVHLRKALNIGGNSAKKALYCPKCGSKTRKNDLYCRECGHKL